MGSREFEFEPESICDGCGVKGAWDIYGDLLCEKCLNPDMDKFKQQWGEGNVGF